MKKNGVSPVIATGLLSFRKSTKKNSCYTSLTGKRKFPGKSKKTTFAEDTRGVSPVIATVLLIAIVVVLALVLFLWFRSFTQEATLKNGKNIELVCEEVQFSAEYDSASAILSVSNEGNIPVNGFKVLVEESGDRRTIDVSGVGSGQVAEIDLTTEGLSEVTKMKVIPILKGVSSKGDSTYICEDRYAQEIEVV